MQYINSYTANHNIEGYFGMADYDYSNKYYLSAAFRRDGTSRFLDRWGNFWSVGAAWRISNEAFMEGTNSWLNDLKLRASYGTQGNESILRSMTMPMCTRLIKTNTQLLGMVQSWVIHRNSTVIRT